ncbi:hypothetical protein ACFV08_28985 [Streptomyces fradiae]|uniref:hypothetical protein n=1 Tax=Streptomyces fradiae TaxID=1906 RepID=UPI003695312C
MLSRLDRAVFAQVAKRTWPAAEPVLPRLSRSANRGVLWFGIAAGMWALGGARGRRAAMRGAASLALASLTVNTLAKGAVGGGRPGVGAGGRPRRPPRPPPTRRPGGAVGPGAPSGQAGARPAERPAPLPRGEPHP